MESHFEIRSDSLPLTSSSSDALSFSPPKAAFSKLNKLSLNLSQRRRSDIEEGVSLEIEAPQEFFEKFEVVKRLGKGRQGVVYKVLDKTSLQYYAAKFYKTNDEEKINLILNEANILERLNHRNITKFISFLQDPSQGLFVLISEYFQSITLEEFLIDSKEKPYSLNKAFILQQIFNVLIYLQDNLILHRDFNLSNILIEPQTSIVKIIDFGLSKCLTAEDFGNTVSPQGNPNFRIPKMFELCKNPFAADIWSGGIVALSVVSGQTLSTKKCLKMHESKKTTEKKKVTEIFTEFLGFMGEMLEENENSRLIFQETFFLGIFRRD